MGDGQHDRRGNGAAGIGARQPGRGAPSATVPIPVPGRSFVLVDPTEHRADVVQRLLLLGVSTQTLRVLLPSWTSLVTSVAATLPIDASGRVVGAPISCEGDHPSS